MNTTIKPADYFDYTMYDGYDWLQRMASAHSFSPIAEYGEWPYLIAVNGARDNGYVIKEYCEHDVKTWFYPLNERDQYTAHLNQLRSTEA